MYIMHIKTSITRQGVASLILRGQQMMKFMRRVRNDFREEFTTNLLSSLET